MYQIHLGMKFKILFRQLIKVRIKIYQLQFRMKATIFNNNIINPKCFNKNLMLMKFMLKFKKIKKY